MIELKKSNGEVISTGETMKAAILAADRDLRFVELRNADLSGLILNGVDFSHAVLENVNFRQSRLRAAGFRFSRIRDCNFQGADLEAACFYEGAVYKSDFTAADLVHSSILRSYLNSNVFSGDTILPSSLTYEEFIALVPELLLGGGQPWEKVISEYTWECHMWDNCPMHAAFGARCAKEIPARWRAIAHDFVRLYDSGLIKREMVLEAKKKADKAALEQYELAKNQGPA